MIYEDYTIFTPGPVKMSDEILSIGAKQTPYFRNQLFSNIVLESEQLLLEFVNAPKNSRVIFLTASGTAGMESVVMNILNQQNNALIVNGGGFGQRFVDICKSYDITHSELNPKNLDLSDIDNIDGSSYDTFIVNAHETSIGKLYNLDNIGTFCKKYNLLNIVDAISMFITDPLDMQRHNIDIAIISSQKGLALPPGLTMVILNPKAINKINTIKNHYFNFLNYLEDGKRGQTPYTPAVSIILQLFYRLKQIQKDGGINFTINQAKQIATYFRENIQNLPLAPYTQYMPNAMTALTPTDNKKAIDIVNILENRYKTIVCPNGGKLKNKIFRVSHMGDMNIEYIDILIKKLQKLYKFF